ncbi:type I polyketide synthase [Kibdelosporangium persicum]|uniref:Polyketide-type polyunsaturated fatty acid synthase PfaA n=1 Tax=Kibdelosporangium persicum TaxID=2698649 RepID=A0ABX2F8D0_9PSEU|nr:type I polyketide synthase [Kibdelosporangium persicum]NRN67598.1 Polyketide-type polyunsaturated fatty acid synthase PfaA [Kibdelosporangium persicum]
MSAFSCRDLVIGVSPLGVPNAALVVAVERAGGLGVLDLGRDRARALAELAAVRRRLGGPFGARLASDCPLRPDELPDDIDVILTPQLLPRNGRRLLVEVTSVDEARAAVRHGADGLVARGCESGVRVGEPTTFVLLQRLLAEFGVPVWAAGGIGPNTAAAAVAGGARGVVLDSQLALVTEVRDCLDVEVVAAIEAMDGADTTIVDGRRVLTLPGAGYPIPIGQDGALANGLRQLGGTAGGVVQAIHKTVKRNLESAFRNPAIRQGGRFCERAGGPRYPLAQGPMTRVSDQPAFAEAVAAAGGLPFLALALMNGEQTRQLLARTAALLSGRPWGVGILGFAEPELRQAQLAEVLAVRPPYAIVAGGNPAQARTLEDAGIEAFLHVPSPALLRNFLDDGARKFVFEGWECGGHTGPRSSFTLWEQQISVLSGRASLAGVSVLFAGGIHDERSAAMVSAMAAPLVDKGAAVGVLMGTAYLFTREAVEHGAITPVFQQVALECARTALLETSPGHSVRCAQSSFVDMFEAAKAELAGAPRQDAWQQLEQLNLGRLRIASRAVKRDGPDLVAVGEDEQRRTGMFMIGQVATLRSELTDLATLHEQVTRTEFLQARYAELAEEPEPPAAEPLDIAIVGMAAMLPGAGDVAEYWTNIVAGVDAITEVPADRWDTGLYQDATPSRWGGFLDPVPFDALAYGIPPASLTSIEPAQLLALEAAARALTDAGYRTREFDRDRTSVIFGAEAGADLANAYTVRSALPALYGSTPEGLDDYLPKLTEDSFPGVLGNVIAGRIANRLDLGGANYTVDAACASSLAALDVACKELKAGTSDMVLCGAVDLHNSAHDYLMFASVQALSPSGRCATFDSAADGIALGEGVACVVLKRLADAERDGDRIYAVVKGIGASSDGKSLGLTAPRADGQRRALQRAYGSAGVSAKEVGLVEAHGTGTVVGDRTELAALTEMFTEAGADPGSCTIGSVKSQIGHTKCTAGLAGLIKAATAVHTGIRPGTLHVTKPNPYWKPETSPFAFGHRTWSAPAERRTAGISAFGFGGTNFHTVITGYGGADEPRHGLRDWPAELFVFRGADQAAVQRVADRVARLVRANDAAGRPFSLRDMAMTAAGMSPGQPVQATAVVEDLEHLPDVLADVRAWRASPAVRLRDSGDVPKIAFLYPGQGSQRPGMVLDLFTAFPRLQETLRLAGGRYEDVMFPPAATTPEEADRHRAAITDTTVAQPTLGIAGLAVTELLAWHGIRPDMAGGHSYGELVALTAAGVFEPGQLLELSEARAKAIVRAVGDDPGAMAAVTGSIDQIRGIVPDDVVVANHNSPTQAVISGGTRAIAEAVRILAEAGLSARTIPVAAAFHSPLVARAEQHFAEVLASQEVREATIPVWSNVDALPYGDVRATLARQVAAEVRFVDQIEAMYAAGARVFVEAGPGGVLTGLVRKILGDRPYTAVACDAPGHHGIRTFLNTLAELAVAGVPVDVAPLFTGRAHRVRPEDIPARPQWFVDGGLVRDAHGKALTGGLRPATEAPRLSAPAGLNRDAIVKEFLDGMREAVAAQRDVLLGYLGTTPATPAPAARTAVVPEAVTPAPVREPEKTVDVAAVDVGTVVLETISARTGYPPEMLEPGLDLEADLSIDSIKRTEIIGELASALGVTGDGSAVEALTGIKTIEGIVSWFGQRETAAAPVPRQHEVVVEGGRPVRQVPTVVTLDACPEPTSLTGRRILIVDDGGDVGLELTDRIERLGGTARTVDQISTVDADYVLYLSALRSTGEPTLPEAYEELRTCLTAGIKGLIVATAGGGTFGHGAAEDDHEPLDLGMHGLIRTAALEYPDLRVRAVDVSPKESHRLIAASLLAELTTVDGPAVVGHASGERYAIELRTAELDGDGQPDLDQDSVVVLTGGARGITALAAIELAERTGCRIELIGRTAPPKGPEDPRTATATSEAELRRALIETGLKDRDEIAVRARRILAEREIRQTMDALRSSAASVRYHACDVQDVDAVHAVLNDIVARFGRIDGVVHGAGVLDDKLMADKTPEGFARVYHTKVGGARALAKALRHNPKFVVMFGSISGVLGNRGQADYAAANDTLDRIARFWAGQTGARVVSVDWGPWAGSGMAADLAEEYARRGIRLIDPRAGVEALLREIAVGDAVQVVYQCGR